MTDTADLLLEIGTEEIPSGYFDHIMSILSGKEDSPIKEIFAAHNISLDNASSFSTPRRIILYIKDLPTHQDKIIEGPPTRVAFNDKGQPLPALLGFLRTNNASLGDIETYKDEREERVRLVKRDIPNKAILEELLPKVIKSLDFPKTMRWGKQDLVFARPIRWILAIFGRDILRFSIGGIESSNITCGHRFLGKGRIKVKDSVSYFKMLSKNKVIWNNQERKERILSFLQKNNWYENRGLLEEVNNLIEFPFFLQGTFKKEYLGLPKEVLLASMSKHQRIFCLKNKHGQIDNRFIAVINGKYRGLRNIRRHYEDVLDARLKDALFFYNSDIKKPLSKWQGGLDEVIFHKELGTLKDKVERMKEIAAFLTRYIDVTADEKKDLNRAVSLCKVDLLTQMVREFPSLQGIMGKYYAMACSENMAVSEAIGEHYLPRFSDDILPSRKLAAICSLADKFDNIICYFKIGKFPKGNWDLYALRRQGIAIISILLNKSVSVSLSNVFDHIYEIAPGDYEIKKLKDIYLDFFKERFISFVKERYNFRYDLIDSVTVVGTDDLYNCFLKLESLNSIIEKSYFEQARCIAERTHNITRSLKIAGRDIKASLFKEEYESSLYKKYIETKKRFIQLCSQKEYQQATRAYGEGLYDEIHIFFDKVLVNVDDKELRGNRMALLSGVNRLYVDNIADLSKIVVSR